MSGFVAAFYRSRPKESIHYANRKTFVTLQLETYDERKKSADTLYETRQLSRKEIQRRLSDWPSSRKKEEYYEPNEPMKVERVKTTKMPKPKKTKKLPQNKKTKTTSTWEEWDI